MGTCGDEARAQRICGASGEREELAAWLRLAATPGVGPALGRKLLARFGLPLELFEAGANAVEAAVHSPSLGKALFAGDGERERSVTQSLAWLDTDSDIPRSIITLGDPHYPPRLLHLADPPLLLYVEGEPEALVGPQIGIVGSRNATASGLETAMTIAEALVKAGWAVVSGLAEGIDQAAHRGALEGVSRIANGVAGATSAATIAVMGTGIDRVYPSRHRTLARSIARAGALVSELPPGTAPTAFNFPRRNRLIAALAEGVLVVEAAMRSGSLITARAAADIGREVFAVPGSIHSPQSRGCHWLIRQGAALVQDAEDILSEHSLSVSRRAQCSGQETPGSFDRREKRRNPVGEWADTLGTSDATCNGASDDSRSLLDLLAGGSCGVDTLIRQTGRPIGELLAALQRLELAGWLECGPDGRWYRIR